LLLAFNLELERIGLNGGLGSQGFDLFLDPLVVVLGFLLGLLDHLRNASHFYFEMRLGLLDLLLALFLTAGLSSQVGRIPAVLDLLGLLSDALAHALFSFGEL